MKPFTPAETEMLIRAMDATTALSTAWGMETERTDHRADEHYARAGRAMNDIAHIARTTETRR